MNSITHAYSVVAFLLVIGCTLIVFPISVFSQSSDDTTTLESEATSTMVLTTTGDDSALEIEIGSSTESDVAAPTASRASNTILDNYPREKLPGDQFYQDFVVGPGRFVLEIAPGESKTVEMVISNRMSKQKRFSFGTEDISGSSDGSQAVVLLANQKGPYTLRDFIKIPYMQFDLGSNERVRVPVTVSLPKDAEPGGHYGSLLVSIVSDPVEIDPDSGAKPGSVVISRIGTLFFVTTPGTLSHDGKLQKFGTVGDKKIYNSGPISFSVVSENLGSVHLAPSGEIKVYNMVGSEVGGVELDPWFVMPNSIRIREVSWNRDFMMGRYTAVAKIDRGYDDLIDEQSFVFWVVPWKIIASVFVGLFLFFMLLRFIFSQFEFKRKSK